MIRLWLIALLCAPLSILGQNIPTGTWRTHYSFNTTLSISQSDKDMFAASSSGLFIVGKSDKSISSLTKLNGLSDTGITQIGFNEATNTLMIAYENGLLDLLKENNISTIPDIKLSEILESKTIHHMTTDGEYTYLSADFGVVQVDTKNQLVKDSFLKLSSSGTNLKVYASVIYNDSLFIATENGVMAGDIASNLKDFNQWKRFEISTGISQETTKVLGLYDGKPITGNVSQGLMTYENGLWVAIGQLAGSDFEYIETSNSSKTLISIPDTVYQLNEAGLSQIQSEFITSPLAAISSGDIIWVADNQNGLLSIASNASESIYPNGPAFSIAADISSINNRIFVFPPYKTTGGNPIRSTLGFSTFENGIWKNYNSTGFPHTNSIPEFLDISGVSGFMNDGFVFSSYGYGLLAWKDNEFSIIDESTSPLFNSSPPGRNVLIADISNNNEGVWVLNNKATNALHFLSDDNSWVSYSPTNIVSDAKQIVSTPWGEQWITINSTSGGGIVVFSTTKGELSLKASGNTSIPSNKINDLLLDEEDKMWVATDKGVVYYPFAFDIFNDPAQEPVIPIIDFNLLFNQEKVNALAVDGGNRVWMGTENGAWLFKNDGAELVEHFTIENSPLLSNSVLKIAINDLTGEVFFATDKGIISYRGTGSKTGTYATPKIFPNPVTPDFNGVVTIEGVPTNSSLKITNASGRLVSNLQANGNTATWDMHNEYFSEVGTGVYFVFISSEDGTEKQVGKIAVVK